MDTQKKDPSTRQVSRYTRETIALVLAGGRGSRLKNLTDWRAKPGVPFGGKFRIIDFPLSNCINSGIRRIGVVTQYKAHSLIKHIQRGWSFLRAELGEFVELLPAQQYTDTSWYAGTADAVYQNIDILKSHKPEYILILAGDHVYKMDYGLMLAHHVECNADITVGCIEVPIEEAKAFGVMSIDDSGYIKEFAEKPENPQPMPGSDTHSLASMGIYIFKASVLFDELKLDASTDTSSHDFGKDIIPAAIEKFRVFSYHFRNQDTGVQSYWRDVGTIDAYWQANLELVNVTPELNLYDDFWPIWTYQPQLPPAKFIFDEKERCGTAKDSMISGGCIVSGSSVKKSLLYSHVHVKSYSTVEESVILPDVVIGEHCRIRKTIIDKGCIIPDGTTIGYDPIEDAKKYHVSPTGVVLVTPDMIGQEYFHGA